MKRGYLDEYERATEYQMLFEDEKSLREKQEMKAGDDIENLKENHRSMMQAH